MESTPIDQTARKWRAERWLGLACLVLAFSGAANATPLNVSLGFASLPSAQGWTYNAVSSGRSESQVFSVDGTTLFQDSITGQTAIASGQGGNWYERDNNSFDHNIAWVVELTAKVTADDIASFNYGFYTSIHIDGHRWSFGLSTTKVQFDDVGTPVAITGNVFHDYRLEGDPVANTWRFLVDGSLFANGTLAAAGDNLLALGDGTNGANERAQVTFYHAYQVTVPEPASLGALGLGALAFIYGRKRRAR